MKISESKVPYSLGLEQVSGPLGSQREHFVGMMGPEQDRILPCELNLLPHSFLGVLILPQIPFFSRGGEDSH